MFNFPAESMREQVKLFSMAKVHMKLSAATKDQASSPWLWRLAREFDVEVNLLKANVDEDFGWVFISLSGPLDEIQRAIAWLQTTGLNVDPVERSVSEE